MKQYEIIPRLWNNSHTELVADECNIYNVETYDKALVIARRMSCRFDRVDIEFTELKRSECYDNESFETEWECNRGEYLKWTESFSGGRQVPAVFFGDTPIWRWGANNKDLKPRKS